MGWANVQNDAFYGYIATENKEETVKALKENESYIPLFLKYAEEHKEWGLTHEKFIDAVVSEIDLTKVSPPVAKQVDAFAQKFWEQSYDELDEISPLSEEIIDHLIDLCQNSHVTVARSYIRDHLQRADYNHILQEAKNRGCFLLCQIILEAVPNTAGNLTQYFLHKAISHQSELGLQLFLKHCPEPLRRETLHSTDVWQKVRSTKNVKLFKQLHDVLSAPKQTELLASCFKDREWDKSVLSDIKPFLELFPTLLMTQTFAEKAHDLSPVMISNLLEYLQSTLVNDPVASEILVTLLQNGRLHIFKDFLKACEPDQRDLILTRRTSKGITVTEAALENDCTTFENLIEMTKNKDLHFRPGTRLLEQGNSVEKFNALMRLCPEPLKNNLWTSQDEHGTSAIYKIFINNQKELAKLVLESLTETAKEAFYKPDPVIGSPMHKALKCFLPNEILELVFKQCPPEYKSQMYKADANGDTPLSISINYPFPLNKISLMYREPPKDMEAVVSQEMVRCIRLAVEKPRIMIAQEIYEAGSSRVDFFKPFADGKTLLTIFAARHNFDHVSWFLTKAAEQHKYPFFEESAGNSAFSLLMEKYKPPETQIAQIILKETFRLPSPLSDSLKQQLKTAIQSDVNQKFSKLVLQSEELKREHATTHPALKSLLENEAFRKNAFRIATNKGALKTLLTCCPTEKRDEMLFNIDARGTTPFFDIVTNGTPEAITFYLENMSIDQQKRLIAPDNNQENPLYYAFKSKKPENVTALLHAIAPELRQELLSSKAANTPLQQAMLSGISKKRHGSIIKSMRHNIVPALLENTTDSERESLYNLPNDQDIFAYSLKNDLNSIPDLLKWAPSSQQAKLQDYDFGEIIHQFLIPWQGKATISLLVNLPDPLPRSVAEAILSREAEVHTFIGVCNWVVEVLNNFGAARIRLFKNDAILNELLKSPDFLNAARKLDTPEELDAVLKGCTEDQKRQILLNRDDKNRQPLFDMLAKGKNHDYMKFYLEQALALDISVLFDVTPSPTDITPLECASFIQNNAKTVKLLLDTCPPSSKDAIYAAFDLTNFARIRSESLGILLKNASPQQLDLLYRNMKPEHFHFKSELDPAIKRLLFAHTPSSLRKEVFGSVFKETDKFLELLTYIPIEQKAEYKEYLEEAVNRQIEGVEKSILEETNETNLTRFLGESVILNPLLERASFTEKAFKQPHIARIIMQTNKEAVQAFIASKGGFEKLSPELRLSLLPLHEPSQIRQTVAEVPDEVKLGALEEEILLEARTKEVERADGNIEIEELGAEQRAPVGHAFQIIADDIIANINWSLATNTMQEQAKKLLKQITLQTLAYAAEREGLQATVAKYWRLCDESELAVLIPQLSPAVFVDTIKEFPNLATQTGYLSFATLEQRQAYLEKAALHTRDFSDWEMAKGHFEAAVERKDSAEGKFAVEEFAKYARELTLFENAILQLNRLKQMLSTGETSAEFQGQVEAATKKAIDRIEGMRRELPKLRAQVEALYVEEKEEEIPPEFLDPITDVIMENPIILPGMGKDNKVVVDESSIREKTADSWKNPFNRQPYKPEEYVPDTELKKQIVAWQVKQKSEPSPS